MQGAAVAGDCLCTAALLEETDFNWCLFQNLSDVKEVLDAASSPVAWANNTLIQALPYLGRARCCVNTPLTAKGRAHPCTHVCVHQQWIAERPVEKGDEDSEAGSI